ncbi:MAG: hypothetical protein JSW68_08835 [Burkholderiales bacterium]|nr:MAG: hypothetical protein JSW68_08835 [Burkholderiales bacterium]
MPSVTPVAAATILRAAAEAGYDEPLLRLAARFDEDTDQLQFGIGFDERREQDLEVISEGVTVLVSPPSQPAVDDLVIDYVEYEPGDFRFIFYRAGSAPSGEGSTGP